MLLVRRAHKPNFFCSSGDQIVATVAVCDDWCCEKSTFSACEGLSLKEISVAVYLFSKGSFLVPSSSHHLPKRRENVWSL